MASVMTAPTTASAASSSKRPAPMPTPQSTKRPRLTSVKPGDVEDDDEEEADPEDLSEEAQAKRARKEARTIRNRESAQRSRNQRKQHLAWLEKRVVELEAENRRLKSGSTPASSSPARETSPAHSVLSLANDLGLPTELVSTSGGVNLASVAPPPQGLDVDVKPVIPVSPAMTVVPLVDTPSYSDLHAENGVLRERVRLLESLVKNAIALSNLGGSPTPPQYTETPTNISTTSNTSSEMIHQPSVDWDNFLQPGVTSLQSTLSPSFHPPRSPPSSGGVHVSSKCSTRRGPAAGEATFDLSIGDVFQPSGGRASGEGGSESRQSERLAFALSEPDTADQLSAYESNSEEMSFWGAGAQDSWGTEENDVAWSVLEGRQGDWTGAAGHDSAGVDKEGSLGLEWWSLELGMGSAVAT